MKHLYIIGGTMGVGKTTVCRILKEKLEGSVFLDGDWCWDMHPFQVTEETKRMVQENIVFVLNNFLSCTAYDHVIFCWVLHQQNIIDDLLARLRTDNCEVHLKSSGWIVKLWRIFLEKSRNLKLHILQMCLHPSKTSLHFLRWFSWIRCTHICRCGGIGRRKGLKILRRVISVPVRVRPPALSKRD